MGMRIRLVALVAGCATSLLAQSALAESPLAPLPPICGTAIFEHGSSALQADALTIAWILTKEVRKMCPDGPVEIYISGWSAASERDSSLALASRRADRVQDMLKRFGGPSVISNVAVRQAIPHHYSNPMFPDYKSATDSRADYCIVGRCR